MAEHKQEPLWLRVGEAVFDHPWRMAYHYFLVVGAALSIIRTCAVPSDIETRQSIESRLTALERHEVK